MVGKVEELMERLRGLREEEEMLRGKLDLDIRDVITKGSIVERYVKCCKECKCNNGRGHGPYLYLVYKDGHKTIWKYIKDKKVIAIRERLIKIEKEKKEILSALSSLIKT